MTTVSMVPGSIVDRNTHSSGRRLGDRCRTAVPISSETEDTYDSSSEPSSQLGVPTHATTTSASESALPSVVAAVRRFSARALAKVSSIPGSFTGERPPLVISTFCGFTSTPTTVAPLRNMQAAPLTPQYPSPHTTIFMANVPGSVQATSSLCRKLQQPLPGLVPPRSTKS